MVLVFGEVPASQSLQTDQISPTSIWLEKGDL